MMMMMMMATLSMNGKERERGRERQDKKTKRAGTFHISLRVFNVDRPFFALLFPPFLFHLLMTTKFIHFVQDLVAYNRRNDGLTDPVRR